MVRNDYLEWFKMTINEQSPSGIFSSLKLENQLSPEELVLFGIRLARKPKTSKVLVINQA